jgi:methane/ammonia monooxygenase subunit B
MITRVESYLNGVPARQSFSKLELGRDYEFKLIMKGRVPGRHHIHPLLSIEGSGPLVGPGQWIEVTGSKADYVMPVTTMNGLKIDNIEFYGTARALKWYGVWIALAAFWLLFWLVRPLLLPRWMALQKGREDVLISTRDVTVGVILGVVVVAISFGGYIYANKEYPYVVPLQAGTNKVDPLPLPKSDVKVVVTKASYDVPGRAMYVTARMTNNGPEAVSILEFATANLRFVNLQAPGADKVISPDYPRDLVARGGMGLSDQKPLMPGETREIKFEASDAMWEVERLVSFLTDVDSKFGGLLFFVDKSGNRMMTEIGGPILPTFTAL